MNLVQEEQYRRPTHGAVNIVRDVIAKGYEAVFACTRFRGTSRVEPCERLNRLDSLLREPGRYHSEPFLPDSLIGTGIWTPEMHKFYCRQIRSEIKVILLLAAKTGDGKPLHPEAPFHRLPPELLRHVIRAVAKRAVFQQWKSEPEKPVLVTSLTGEGSVLVSFPRFSCDAVILQFRMGCLHAVPGFYATGVLIGPYLFSFQPGFSMPSGSFSGPVSGGCGIGHNIDSVDMGWVPAQDQLHLWKIVLRRTGRNDVIVRDAKFRYLQFNHSWTDELNPIFRQASFKVCFHGMKELWASDICVWFQ